MDEKEQKILQKHLARFIIEDVFNAVTKDDLLRIERSSDPRIGEKWYHKGQEIPEGNRKVMKEEAEALQKSVLWKILKAELLYWAHKKGNIEAVTTDDIIAAKLMQYTVDVIESKLKDMKR